MQKWAIQRTDEIVAFQLQADPNLVSAAATRFGQMEEVVDILLERCQVSACPQD